ncbi:MAG: GtrA family protein [Methylococcaceae bacterium]
MRAFNRSWVRYLLIGGIAYLVDVLLFSGARFLLLMPIAHANMLARGMGAITAYGLNHSWTFKQPLARIRRSAWRYFSLWLINTSLSTTLLQGLSELTTVPGYSIILKAIVELLLVLSNFFVCKFWVFKAP